MAISSAIRTGSLMAMTFPRIAILAFLVTLAMTAASRFTQGVLLVIFVVQHVGFLGVEIGVRKAQTPRVVRLQVLIGDIPVGLLREPVDLDVSRRPRWLLDQRCLFL